jgi:hypothetical protein
VYDVITRVLTIMMFSVALMAATGCEQEGPAERAGAKLDEAMEDGRNNIEDAVERAGDAVEEAGDKIENASE